MTIQLSSNSFLQMLAQSQLLRDEQMKTVEKRFSADNGGTNASTQDIMVWLLKRHLITPWHAEKLIQGRFRGFFLGSYKLLNRVARGGMSTIYSAEEKETGEIHALKVLPLSKTKQASYLQRFRREATITQRLNHPNIVRVFGIFSATDGQADVHFMAMELLQGRDLFELVNDDGPLPCRQAVDFIRQAAKGLHYAHQAGLVHRDIKPGNLFLSDDQTVRILDLGLAQDFDSEENLTREFNERVLGTADYLSPEQAADSHTVDARADIYSLGCSLFFLLTGQAPFTEGTLVQRLIAHQTKVPPAVSEFRSDVPDELINILGQMMAKNRNDRTATADRVVEQLVVFLAKTSGQSILNKHPTILKRAVPAEVTSPETATPGVASQRGAETHSTSRDDSSPAAIGSAERVKGGKVLDCFLPEFATLLKRIQSDCDVKGTLFKDSRSARLLALSKELLQQGEVVEKKFEFLAAEAPAKWSAEDTVLNDVLASEPRFDLKTIKLQEDKEIATKIVIEELLAAAAVESESPASDSSVPMFKTIDAPRRSAKPPRSDAPILYWVLAAIGAFAVVAAIVYAFM
ncbi:MAG TPA: serine/threonine-protein kinase [Planctomycetaceae bacterium]|nr:serine/threonine-protein kinase [Planctomycetaceae bacterium]